MSFAVIQHAANQCRGAMLGQVVSCLSRRFAVLQKTEVHALVSIVVSCGLRVASGSPTANTCVQHKRPCRRKKRLSRDI